MELNMSDLTIFLRIFRKFPTKSKVISMKGRLSFCFDSKMLIFSGRFLDKLYDFFKPEQTGGFRNIQLIDSLSDVTCRCLIAFSDLLLYPSRISSNHIRYIASNISRALLMSISNALKQVKHFVGSLSETSFSSFTVNSCNERRRWPSADYGP